MPFHSVDTIQKCFKVAPKNHISEMFIKSPFLVDTHRTNDLLSICHSCEDRDLLVDVNNALVSAYNYAHTWFETDGIIPIQLWMAQDLTDLHYITGVQCTDGSAFSPGWCNEKAIVVLQSPRTSIKNRDMKG